MPVIWRRCSKEVTLKALGLALVRISPTNTETCSKTSKPLQMLHASTRTQRQSIITSLPLSTSSWTTSRGLKSSSLRSDLGTKSESRQRSIRRMSNASTSTLLKESYRTNFSITAQFAYGISTQSSSRPAVRTTFADTASAIWLDERRQTLIMLSAARIASTWSSS